MLAALWTIPAVAGTLHNYYWRRAHDMALPLAVMALAEFPNGVAQAIVVAVSLLILQRKADWGVFQALALFAFVNWFPVLLLVYPVVVGLGYALEVADRLRREQIHAAMVSGRLVQAQLAALRAQLHPHMMFNSLNTAVSLVRTGDNQLAVGVLTDLSEIVRHVLRGAATQEVSLSDEIRFVERCVALEQARFPGRIEGVVDVHWSVRDALVPNLILQPIVENALRHGITQRGIGGLLEIVLYGRRATLRLANRPGGGAEVVLRLPLHTRPASPHVSGPVRSVGVVHLAVGD